MKKTRAMKILAVISAVLTGAVIAARIYLAFNPYTVLHLLNGSELYEAELTTLSRSLLIISSVGILPMTILYLFNAFTSRASAVKGAVTLVLCGVFYMVYRLADAYFSGRVNIECSRDGLYTLALAGTVMTAYTLIGLLLIISMILMCCASGAEVYAARHEKAQEAAVGGEEGSNEA